MVRNTCLGFLYKSYVQLFKVLLMFNVLRSWTNMVCDVVPLLLKRNNGVLFGVLRGPCSDAPPTFFLLGMGSVSL
jgi:hypothetical protein